MSRTAIYCVVATLVTLTVPVYAGQPGATNPSPQPPAAAPNGRIQVFDDRIFDLSSDKPAPTTRKDASGNDRYLAEDPDYNTQQRKDWIEKCTVDGAVSKPCFQNEKQKSSQDLRNKFNKVESDQGVPFEKRIPSGEKPTVPGPAYRDMGPDSN